ncbi:MAG: HEAT repeat domain-containing protein, partial [Planctomycetota bacterium]
GRPRATALLAVAGLDGERGAILARKVLCDRALEVRVAATEILAGIPGERGLAAAEIALKDESWSVRLTAIRALAVRAEAASIPPLIGALRREDGRLREEAGEALAAVTGVGLPPDPRRWASWWAKAKGEFKVPEKPAAPPKARDESVVTFHSIPVVSRTMAFVLDRSRSMNQRIARDEERRKGEMVESELRATLERMGRSSRFLLVAFRTEPEVFHPRPVPIAARRKAADWYASLEPSGRTNLYDAVAIALAEPSIDTIFLLTDGAPSAGEYRNRGAILTAVARANRYRKAVIHTVDIGGGTTGKRWKGFLAELSRSTGGRHVKR